MKNNSDEGCPRLCQGIEVLALNRGRCNVKGKIRLFDDEGFNGLIEKCRHS